MNSEDLAAQLDNAELALEATQRYSSSTAYAAYWASRYRLFHSYAFPMDGDQWPSDKSARPGMIHVTQNVIGPAVMVESRVESRLPRLSLVPDMVDENTRQAAERAEKIVMRWLGLSQWKVWLNELALTKSTYGKGVLKVLWNKEEDRPDVSVIETPQNLRLGWGSSDYQVLDWALYEFELSPVEAMRRFPGLVITEEGRGKNKNFKVQLHGDHSDPLQQRTGSIRVRTDLQQTDYEKKHVRVWDYWTKRDGKIVNAFFVEGTLVKQEAMSFLPDIPFVIVEHDHEPGSPEGIGDVEPLISIQDELNRAYSHWAQLIADEIDPAYQLDAESVPSGIVPRNGQITAAGDGKQIRPIEKSVQTFPIEKLVDAFYDAFHFRSGLSEILFTAPPGAQTAGRALQVQIEASANRIDPRRDRLYAGLDEVVRFWVAMAIKINPKFPVGFDEQGAPVIKGLKEALAVTAVSMWKFVAPEITPRDNIELITAVVNKLNNKLISLEAAMDELGVDSPLAMIQMIEQERMNPRLYPGDVQGFMAAIQMLQQYMAQQQAMGQQGVPLGGANDAAAAAQGALQAQAQGSQPQGIQGDNGSGVPQPATAAGGPPPPGAAAPAGGIANQTLLRPSSNGGTQALQQITVKG